MFLFLRAEHLWESSCPSLRVLSFVMLCSPHWHHWGSLRSLLLLFSPLYLPFPQDATSTFWVQYIKNRTWHLFCQTHCSSLTLVLLSYSSSECHVWVLQTVLSPSSTCDVLFWPPLWLLTLPTFFFFFHRIVSLAFWLVSPCYDPFATQQVDQFLEDFLIVKLFYRKKIVNGSPSCFKFKLSSEYESFNNMVSVCLPLETYLTIHTLCSSQCILPSVATNVPLGLSLLCFCSCFCFP